MYIVGSLLLLLFAMSCQGSREYDLITCGTTLKIRNVKYDVRLHSHDVRYGSGSGQQSVTAVTGADDHNSYWQIHGKTGTQCNRGEPIACGDTIRIFHLSTKKNLHSHLFAAPLTNNAQEVSCFGDNGIGDEGDHFMVVCQSSTEKHWRRNQQVKFRHVPTGAYLQVTGERYQRPISGQHEVAATPAATDRAMWQAAEGIFISSSSSLPRDRGSDKDHDEL